MAQLVLINHLTYREGINEVDDFVGVFSDKHIFSEHEKNIFNIIPVVGSVESVKAAAKAVEPKQAICYKHTDGKWYELAKDPKFPVRYQDDWFKSNIRRYTENNNLMVDKSG